MIYRTETLSPESYRIHWREVGYFRDPVSGEVAADWLNPITGELLPAPKSFEEGPSFYTISLDGDGLRVELEQAHAKVRGIDVTFGTAAPGRVSLTQRERKVRGVSLAGTAACRRQIRMRSVRPRRCCRSTQIERC